MPKYREATYGGETVVLENQHVRLEVHKRRTGWGWGELYVPDGQGGMRFYAVLEHLAELDAEGLPHALRLEAGEYKLTHEKGVRELRFEVMAQQVEPPDAYFGGESPLVGTVVLTLKDDEGIIGYHLDLTGQFLFFLKHLRGAWLRVGADSFGTAKDDAILPGVEWLEGDEWSSGTDWFEHPERLRVTPHPHKVGFPCLAISQGGMGLGLWYKPDLTVVVGPKAYPQQILYYPQPVLASPNFLDCRNDHVLGLMWPSARQGLAENAVAANPAVRVRPGMRFKLEAEIAVVEGRSLDVVVAWVRRHGLPDPGAPRWPWTEAYDKIIRAYDSHLFREGEGFAKRWAYRGKGDPDVPDCIRQYLAKGDDPALVASLKRKVAWCDAQPKEASRWGEPTAHAFNVAMAYPERAEEVAEALLKIQTPEGDFTFDPDGRHQTPHGGNAAYWRRWASQATRRLTWRSRRPWPCSSPTSERGAPTFGRPPARPSSSPCVSSDPRAATGGRRRCTAPTCSPLAMGPSFTTRATRSLGTNDTGSAPSGGSAASSRSPICGSPWISPNSTTPTRASAARPGS